MLSWQVGRVKITRIVEMDLPVPVEFMRGATPEALRKLPWLYPHFVSADDSTLNLSVHALLVEAPGMRLVVDTCVGNDRPREITGGEPMSTRFLEHLSEAGWSRDEVDAVVCTHLHVDHVGWNTVLVGGKWVPTFANARYVFGKAEYEHWRDHSDAPDKLAVFSDSVKPIADAGKADLVASDIRLTDEITLIPTPGHSPGHMSIHIRSEGEEGLLTGDVAHHPCQMSHLDWSSTADSDPKQSAATRRELFSRFADTPTLVIGGHFNAGHIKRDGDAFKFVAL